MKKLYTLTQPAQTLPFSVDLEHRPITADASAIPTLRWPDNAWCIEANMWMLHLYSEGRSRTERGGTLLTYAANLSHLLRFAYANNTPFLSISDVQFSLFVVGLLGERSDKGAHVRNQNSALNIIRNCLDFIHYLTSFFDRPARITIVSKPYAILQQDGTRIMRRGLSHAAMPLETRVSRRLPISAAQIKHLRLAAFRDHTASAFVKERRRVMIRLLEITGGRRLELKHLTVASIAQAKQTGHLRMLVVKQVAQTLAASGLGKNEHLTYREIPINPGDLQLLADYNEFHRLPLMARIWQDQRDHGYLFVSETTGLPLRANTLTFEIQKLRTLAQITEPVSPHLFRHRFITKIFVAQIMQCQVGSVDDFKQAWLNSESLKRKVQELTGHRNAKSLDVYIHLAWDEAGHVREVLSPLEKLQSLSAITEQVTQLIGQLDQPHLAKESQALLELIGAFEALM
ncbi:tyrosine-type recombinase/integrase [Pseudomonas zeae]|uniref:tyrosine-type recombinase/integrase n=1 Tax=Pseudomonas zeae TaxID=2745510 RepID=UPI0039E17907